MPDDPTQYTGSDASLNVSQSVTSSAAITADYAASMGMTSNFSILQTSIDTMLDEKGTKGTPPHQHVSKYLHQRQERIVEYSHRKDGYGFIYIHPTDIRPWGTYQNFQSFPGGTVIPAKQAAFATFRVPKNAYIFTDSSKLNSIEVSLSASAAYIANTTPELYYADFHNITLLSAAHVGKGWGLNHVKLASPEFNKPIDLNYPATIGSLGGLDKTYHTLKIPHQQVMANQSQKIFYGARIPIKMQ